MQRIPRRREDIIICIGLSFLLSLIRLVLCYVIPFVNAILIPPTEEVTEIPKIKRGWGKGDILCYITGTSKVISPHL